MHPFLIAFAFVLLACGSEPAESPQTSEGEQAAAEQPEEAPVEQPQLAPAEHQEAVEGLLTLSSHGTPLRFESFTNANRVTPNSFVVVARVSDDSEYPFLSIQMIQEGLRDAVPTTVTSPDDGIGVQEDGTVVHGTPRSTGVFIRYETGEGQVYTGDASVVLESFDDGVLVGSLDEVRWDGRGQTANLSLRSIEFQVEMTE